MTVHITFDNGDEWTLDRNGIVRVCPEGFDCRGYIVLHPYALNLGHPVAYINPQDLQLHHTKATVRLLETNF